MCISPLRTLGLLAFGLFLFLSPVQALTINELKTTVRIEITNDQGKYISFGSGTIIDPDGRILTNAKVVEVLQKYPSYTTTICVTASEVAAPTCNMRATLLKVKPAVDLALLQVNSVKVGNFWISPEEYTLRTGFKFGFIKPDATVLTTEGVKFGDDLKVLTYTATSTATLTQVSADASGFVRGREKGKSVPYLVKVGTRITNGLGGGGVFTPAGKLVGIPAYNKNATAPNGTFVSLPVINSFLKESLGESYAAKTYPFVLTSALGGVEAGYLKTNSCPNYSQIEGGGSVCRCNSGFFAVGNACIAGGAYCPLVYGTNARYDDFLRSCLCPSGSGQSTCVRAPVKPVTPPTPAKPVTPTPAPAPTKPAPPKVPTFSCPANATYNAKTWACACNSGWVRDLKKNACVAKPLPAKK